MLSGAAALGEGNDDSSELMVRFWIAAPTRFRSVDGWEPVSPSPAVMFCFKSELADISFFTAPFNRCDTLLPVGEVPREIPFKLVPMLPFSVDPPPAGESGGIKKSDEVAS